MKRIIRVSILLGVIIVFLSFNALTQLSNSGWPKPGHDANNSNLASDVPVCVPTVKWQVNGASGVTFEGVIIDSEGNVVYKGPWGEPSNVTSVNENGIFWTIIGAGSWDWGNYRYSALKIF